MKYLRNHKLFALMLLALCAATTAQARVRVACMGNSITYGLTLADPATQSYPAVLQNMLGEKYEVGNFGHSGAAVLNRGHHPYTATPEYAAALEFKPDIAVIHLGVNDTDPRSWPNYHSEFESNYLGMIQDLRKANPDVRIIMARLTPLRATHKRFRSGTRIWRLEAQKAIERVAASAGVELIDFDEPLRDRQNLLHDGIHPDAEGAKLLASEAYKGITGQYGPLAMAPVYSSGMVLPHSRYLTLRGTADAYKLISLELDGHRYSTRSDTRGRWKVCVPPLTPGRIYSITVTDGKDTLHIDNIAAGTVWLASGQSNMEFTLAEDADGKQYIPHAADSLLRFFNMRPRAITVDIKWSAQQIDSINRTEYYLPAKWEEVTPANAPRLSAVAYFFARNLRDSLHLPVGIISNSIGGSATESWIDVNTLEEVMPEILIDWQNNDYVQPWVQGRGKLNSGSGRHPYEPSYLFATGIRPLHKYPIDGTIWYQGESNAHNIEIHEILFQSLVNSWRKEFGMADMPFYFAQLSSIARPSWPEFRNSQRLLADRIPHSGMAVTHDHGDSLNVHPRYKRFVGNRLARLALHHTYGFPIEASGPQPIKAYVSSPDTITINFAHARGLRLSGGNRPLTFEVAGADRVFRPAKAEIKDSTIILYDMDTKVPHYVRYAWQPFTRANVENSDSLPASTFEIEVSGIPSATMEPGVEAGLSGCFAARHGNKLIIAGGCNFPGNPFAPGASKKFYRGIYAADTADMQWHIIGELPEPAAYGATAVTPQGIVLIGGSSAEHPLKECRMLTLPNGSTQLADLPSLPVSVDNAAAASIGNMVYLAGGNADGTPSRSLYCLDLAAPASGWTKLKDMPGNPRVQPVMAAARDADGEECLYIFGGFAGRHGSHEPSLELDGLKYKPSTRKWHRLDGPATASGDPVSVGGGAACTLRCGKIAVCGGVNKDVFIEALRNQAPDYLDHDPQWYRFNPYTFIFDPASESWSVALEDAAATARAGAALFPGTDCDLYVYGGELKPRVRTSETTHIICK